MKRVTKSILALVLMLLAGQAPAFTVSDTPLFVTGNVEPNIVLTLDDSGSMRRAFVPEICGDDSNCMVMINRFYKSSHYNALYYNPYVIYTPPKDASGNSLSTAFGAAWLVGFDTAVGSTSLIGSYLPTAGMNLNAGAASHTTNEHYIGERGITGIMLGTNSGSNAPYFDIPNFWNKDGSAAGHDPGTNLVKVTVGGNNFTDDGVLNADACSTSNDPGTGKYRTRIIGTTLRLCFNDSNTYYGSQVEVRLKDVNKDASEPANATAGAEAYYYVFDGNNGGNCAGTAAEKKVNNSCYDYVRVSNTSGPGTQDLNGDGVIDASDKDERQNFANWYSFYRTRYLATASGAALAFADLGTGTRVAWQALNTCRGSTTSLVDSDCDGWRNNFANKSNAINDFSNATHKQNFYAWLYQVPTNGGTPLREAMIRAGEYFSTSGDDSPYDNNFTTANSGEYSCRRNFHILMTDGIWNDSTPASIGGNVDNTSVADLPDADGTNYDPTQNYARLYKDGTSDTLADVAFKYWKTDLRTGAGGLANNLTPIENEVDSDGNNARDADQTIFWNAKNDPATWQHMVNFTIGLGLTDFLAASGLTWTGDMYAGSYLNIRDGVQNWPAATAQSGSDANYGTSAFDLWHAAVNSRGRFFSVESPDQITSAFQAIMGQVKAATPSAAALAANSTKAEVGTRVYQAKFDTSKWNGHLYAFDVNPADGTLSPAAWDAATEVPAHGVRNVYSRGAAGGVAFQWANLTCAQQTYLNDDVDLTGCPVPGAGDGKGSNRVGWLRGDTSNEERFVAGGFRNRDLKSWEKADPGDPNFWVLGDIISSDPEYVGVGSQGYESLPFGSAGQASYATYVSAHKATRTPAIYVGANDGMLHAFNVTNGVELFAVIPDAVFPNLANLTDPAYNHQFFVNGSPNSGDAYLNNALSHASGWNTVVATGLGAGGNSIIAVDATRTDATSASQFMWEYTEADMGYTYSQPQVVRLNDGQWAAVFGNGYKTAGGGAYLYVVNLSDGTLIRKIQAGVDPNNGLSTPMLVDVNNDKIMDYAYAGDLQGNMWKFDLTDPVAANWVVSLGGSPLFVAKDAGNARQPITVQPMVAKEPVTGGYWVFFGTGRYLAEEDIQAAEMAKTHTFYGIWDNGVAVGAYAARTDVLVQQSVITATTALGFDVRVTTDNAVNLGAAVRGWYMDMPGTGERVVSEAITVEDNVDAANSRVVFTTIIPSSDPCDAGGTSWLMEMLYTGKRPASPVFDLDADEAFTDADKVTVSIGGVDVLVTVSGIKSTVGILDTPTWLDKDAGIAFKLVPGTSGATMTIINKGKGAGGTTTRVYWQELL